MLQYNNNLPKEIINIILEYDGRIRYRNGKYIEQINKEDKRLGKSVKNGDYLEVMKKMLKKY